MIHNNDEKNKKNKNLDINKLMSLVILSQSSYIKGCQTFLVFT